MGYRARERTLEGELFLACISTFFVCIVVSVYGDDYCCACLTEKDTQNLIFEIGLLLE